MYDIIVGRSESDKEKWGSKGTILLGKHYVKMGHTTSLSNEIFLDVARSHVVFVCGKRGSGKCVTGDTLITLEDGSLVPIKELDSEQNRSKRVLALDNNLKVRPVDRDGFFKRQVDVLLSLRLRSGKMIKCTPEHPLLTVKGWKDAQDILVGGRIATPRIINAHGRSDLNEAEVKLLAYLIAEGHIKTQMSFTNMDPFIVQDLERAMHDFNPEMELTMMREGQYKLNSRAIKRGVDSYRIIRDELGRMCKGSSISHEKRPIRLFLEEHGLFGLKSPKKFIPEKVMTLPKNKLSLFLNRLFSCDGSIYRKKTGERFCWQISYSSSSIQLIREVQHLLLRFGILARLRGKIMLLNGKAHRAYELVLSSDNVVKFIQEIGFFGKKELRQKNCLDEMKIFNPNVDTIPKEIWDIYRPKSWKIAGDALGYSSGKALRSSIDYSPSRQKLLQIAISDQREDIKLIADSDIFWDEIVSVEELHGTFDVYDISVPKYHNFVANDIIIHNSYTMGVIAEGIADMPPEIKKNISVIMLDTMGIYWTMKYPNLKDKGLLKEWGMEPKGLDVVIYTPTGYFAKYKQEGIPTDYPFSIKPSELDANDWNLSFGIDAHDPVAVFIEKIMYDLRGDTDEEGNFQEYDIDDVIKRIDDDKEFDMETKAAAKNHFVNSKNWGVFDREGTPLSDLAKGGQVTVLDVSCYATQPNSWNIKNLVMGLVAEKLFIHRMIARKDEEYQSIHKSVNFFGEEQEEQQEFPLVWLVIDEAHEFLPVSGKTMATDPLVTILREGRQPGISLILATQQPGKIHTDVMTQADTVIAHRITAKLDTEALGTLMQNYMRTGLTQQLDDLPRVKGAAIIFDDNNEKMYPIRLRPRLTWHGGEDPVAIKKQVENELI